MVMAVAAARTLMAGATIFTPGAGPCASGSPDMSIQRDTLWPHSWTTGKYTVCPALKESDR